MNTDEMPQTLQEAMEFFANEQRCHDFMVALRWPKGVTCPRCGSKNVGKFSGKRRVANCKNCRKQFTTKVKSIFEDSALPLKKWLPAMWMVVNAKNGISSHELHRELGVTQKTAWFMSQRIRLALHEGNFEMMKGRVEADETFIGALSRNMHKDKRREKITGTGGSGKTAVMGLLERSERRHASRVKLAVLKSVKRDELQGHVRKYVLKNSEILTDAANAYNGLNDAYVHGVIDHAVNYARGHVHTNGLENFWSLLKRCIKGTHVHCAPFHLFRYLDDQAFRFNERRGKNVDRFATALSSVVNRRLTYRQLTGKPEPEKKGV